MNCQREKAAPFELALNRAADAAQVPDRRLRGEYCAEIGGIPGVRAALRIGVRDLAKMVGVSAMTVTRFENERSGGYAATLEKIEAAFAARGIEFTNGDVRGVRLRRQRPRGS